MFEFCGENRKKCVVDLITLLNWFWSCRKRRNRNLWFGSHRFFRHCLARNKHLIIDCLGSPEPQMENWRCISCKLPVMSFLFLQSLIKSRFLLAKLPKIVDSLNIMKNIFAATDHVETVIHFFGNKLFAFLF